MTLNNRDLLFPQDLIGDTKPLSSEVSVERMGFGLDEFGESPFGIGNVTDNSLFGYEFF